MPGTRTIVKRRMVETYPFQKLFEVYFMDPEVPEAANRALYDRLQGRAAAATTQWWSPTTATAC